MSEIKENLEISEQQKVKKEKKHRKSPSKKVMITGAIVAVVCFLVVSSLLKKPAIPTVFTTLAYKGDVKETLDSSGLVNSMMEKTYFSPVSAKIQNVGFEVGDNVTTDDLLIQFDQDSVLDQVKKVQLELAANRSGYNDSINRSNQKVDEVNRANTDIGTLKKEIEDKKNELNNTKNELATLTAKQEQLKIAESANQKKIEEYTKQLNQLILDKQPLTEALTQSNEAKAAKQIELDALKAAAIVDAGAIATAEAELAAIVLEIEEANRKIAENEGQQATIKQAIVDCSSTQLQEVTKKMVENQQKMETITSQLSEKQAELSRQESVKTSSQASILSDEARNQLVANNNLKELSLMSESDLLKLAKKGIQAEFPGVITTVKSVVGSTIQSGQELITVASNRDVMVEIPLTKYDLEKVKEGQQAEINLAGKIYQGSVGKISKVALSNAQGIPVVYAQVKFDNPDDDIYLKVEAKVSLHLAQATSVVVIPVEAVNTDRNGSFVYVVENNTLVRKDITTGVASDELIEILTGVKEADQVALSVAATLTQGSAVSPVIR